MFGDPDNGTSIVSGSTKLTGNVPGSANVGGNVLTICHATDNICMGGDQILPAHLTYAQDVGTAAAFVAMMTKLGMGVGMSDMNVTAARSASTDGIAS